MKSRNALKPKMISQKSKDSLSSFSSDEPNVEIADTEELHSSTTSYVLNPKLKASNVFLPCTEEYFITTFIQKSQNDTLVHEGPYDTDRVMTAVQIQGINKNKPFKAESPLAQPKKVTDRHDSTAKKRFSSGNNPHDLIRCAQKEKFVWYATYDEEMHAEKFMETLNSCNDKSCPIVFF